LSTRAKATAGSGAAWTTAAIAKSRGVGGLVPTWIDDAP
jgi:hypothetical protein